MAAAASISPADLERQNLVVYAADDSVVDLLAAEQRARVHRAAGALGALVLASAGVGVAVVPAATERVGLPEIVYWPLRDMVADVEVVRLSRPDELAAPARAFVSSWGWAEGT